MVLGNPGSDAASRRMATIPELISPCHSGSQFAEWRNSVGGVLRMLRRSQ